MFLCTYHLGHFVYIYNTYSVVSVGDGEEILDIELVKLNPTWTNKRIGNVRISKRLDRFLVSEDIMENHF